MERATAAIPAAHPGSAQQLSAVGLTRWGPSRPIPHDGPPSIAGLFEGRDSRAREALVADAQRLTYAELRLLVRRASAALLELGVGPGDRVAASLRNGIPIVAAFLATQRIGGIWVGVPRALAPPEKAYIASDCDATVFLLEDDLLDAQLAEAQPPSFQTRLLGLSRGPGGWLDRVEGAEETADAVEIDPLLPAAISYTSGTTGFPKGAVHSQHNMLVVLASCAAWPGPTAERQAVMNPLTSLNNMISGVLNPLYGGNCCVVLKDTDSVSVAQAIERERVGSIHGSASLYHDFTSLAEIRDIDLSSLVQPFVGGSEIPTKVLQAFEDRTGVGVTIGYGMTEAPMSVSWAGASAESKPGRCGIPALHVAIEIRAEDSTPLPAGEVGEVCVSSAEEGPFAGVYTPMLGYWNQPEATASALDGGVYHTGDLGYLDESGELYLVGRQKELILRGGGNIYPAEVERILIQHRDVEEVCVFGIPDQRLGQRVAAAVVVGSADPESVPTRLRDYCSGRLARFKVPDEFLVVDEIPCNDMGKPLRSELARLWARSNSGKGAGQ